jgi:hypothetical protein
MKFVVVSPRPNIAGRIRAGGIGYWPMLTFSTVSRSNAASKQAHRVTTRSETRVEYVGLANRSAT